MNKLLLLIFFCCVTSNCKSQQLYPIAGGWIKTDGRTIMLSYAESTFPSKNGFARFISKGKYGCINVSGAEQLKPLYTALTDFNEGIAFAKKETGWIAVNTQGEEQFKVIANYVYELKDGMVRFQLGNRFGFINAKGEVVIPANYAGAYDFCEGKARVYTNGKWGCIDTKGKLIIDAKFDYLADFSNGLAPYMKKVGKEEHWGYIDEKGQIKISAQLGYAFPFIGEFALFRKGAYRGGHLVLVNKEGVTQLELPYVDAIWCGNGLINVCQIQNGYQKWGYISTTGEVLIPFEYDTNGMFYNQLAKVLKSGKVIYLNDKGEKIWIEK
jgi:hypothetical protein